MVETSSLQSNLDRAFEASSDDLLVWSWASSRAHRLHRLLGESAPDPWWERMTAAKSAREGAVLAWLGDSTPPRTPGW